MLIDEWTLSQFCSRDHRKALNRPFEQDGHVYATDGKILVCVPSGATSGWESVLREGDEPDLKRPDVQGTIGKQIGGKWTARAPLPMLPPDGALAVSWPQKPELRIKGGIVREDFSAHMDDDGIVTFEGSFDLSRRLEGTWELPDAEYGPTYVEFAGDVYNLVLLGRLRLLSGVRICDERLPEGAPRPFTFAQELGWGVVMPIKRTDGRPRAAWRLMGGGERPVRIAAEESYNE